MAIPDGLQGRRTGARLFRRFWWPARGEALLREAIELSEEGDVRMIKFLLGPCCPGQRYITIALPEITSADDAVEAIGRIMRGMRERNHDTRRSGACSLGKDLQPRRRSGGTSEKNGRSEGANKREHVICIRYCGGNSLAWRNKHYLLSRLECAGDESGCLSHIVPVLGESSQ